jgi:hypothetical protein
VYAEEMSGDRDGIWREPEVALGRHTPRPCGQCGYDTTGLEGPICPECGGSPERLEPSAAWGVGAAGLYFSAMIAGGALFVNYRTGLNLLGALSALALAGTAAGGLLWCTVVRRHFAKYELMTRGDDWALAGVCWIVPVLGLLIFLWILLVGR